MSTTTGRVYTRDDWAEFLTARHSGARVEIDEEMFYYWLEVLPPVTMNTIYTLGGTPIRTTFGFAEGYERITAFWSQAAANRTRYFCQDTGIVNTRG